jgi:antitoxin (DNA-binding transcriptional repressor) of toxin-antitoxin stability system
MTVTVEIENAEAHLSDLLSKVEAGEEVIIARDKKPVAKLTRILSGDAFDGLIVDIKSARAGRRPTTPEEIIAWRDEGRHF